MVNLKADPASLSCQDVERATLRCRQTNRATSMEFSATEKLHLGSNFRASLYARQELNIYLNPLRRALVTRAVIPAYEKKTRQLPPGLLFVGCYRAPFPEGPFVEDLVYVAATVDAAPALCDSKGI